MLGNLNIKNKISNEIIYNFINKNVTKITKLIKTQII